MAVTGLEITITADVRTVSNVREVFRCLGNVFDCVIDHEVVALLVTELLANSIHAQDADITVSATRLFDATLRVEVHDDGGGWPKMSKPDALDDNGGRGLMIVDALAASWGAVTTEADGTTVWFEVPTWPAGTELAEGSGDAASQDMGQDHVSEAPGRIGRIGV